MRVYVDELPCPCRVYWRQPIFGSMGVRNALEITPAALTNSSHVTLPEPLESIRSMIAAICFIVGSRPS